MSDPLVLVGMLDSPFVRRVAITLRLAGVPYDNLPLRTFGDAARFAAYSPLKRAPTLVLPGGEALFDSQLILTHLAELYPAVAALLPSAGDARRAAYQVIGVALGVADKAVAGIYEKTFHPPAQQSPVLLGRLAGQLRDALAWLEQRAPTDGFLGGAAPSQADVTVGATLCFAREAHPELVAHDAQPRVRAWCARLDALPAFAETYLPLDPPRPAQG